MSGSFERRLMPRAFGLYGLYRYDIAVQHPGGIWRIPSDIVTLPPIRLVSAFDEHMIDRVEDDCRGLIRSWYLYTLGRPAVIVGCVLGISVSPVRIAVRCRSTPSRWTVWDMMLENQKTFALSESCLDFLCYRNISSLSFRIDSEGIPRDSERGIIRAYINGLPLSMYRYAELAEALLLEDEWEHERHVLSLVTGNRADGDGTSEPT